MVVYGHWLKLIKFYTLTDLFIPEVEVIFYAHCNIIRVHLFRLRYICTYGKYYKIVKIDTPVQIYIFVPGINLCSFITLNYSLGILCMSYDRKPIDVNVIQDAFQEQNKFLRF